jgi:hypothetical protein
MYQGTSEAYRARGTDAHASGDGLEVWGGIVSAKLEQWAEELGCTPDDVLGAVDSAGIDPLVDTAQEKGRSRSDPDRATDPTLRCLALTIDDARTLKSVLG